MARVVVKEGRNENGVWVKEQYKITSSRWAHEILTLKKIFFFTKYYITRTCTVDNRFLFSPPIEKEKKRVIQFFSLLLLTGEKVQRRNNLKRFSKNIYCVSSEKKFLIELKQANDDVFQEICFAQFVLEK